MVRVVVDVSVLLPYMRLSVISFTLFYKIDLISIADKIEKRGDPVTDYPPDKGKEVKMLQRAELSARTNGRLGSFNLLVWAQIVLYFFLNFLQPFSLLKEILFVLEGSGNLENIIFVLLSIISKRKLHCFFYL